MSSEEQHDKQEGNGEYGDNGRIGELQQSLRLPQDGSSRARRGETAALWKFRLPLLLLPLVVEEAALKWDVQGSTKRSCSSFRYRHSS